MDRTEHASLKELESYKSLVKEGYQPLKVLDEDYELARLPDLGCHFLEDSLCRIHGEAGPGAKPTVCQLYPFQLVRSPGGYYISLAFSCPAVISGTGEELSKHREGLRQTVLDSPYFFPPELKPPNACLLYTSPSPRDRG